MGCTHMLEYSPTHRRAFPRFLGHLLFVLLVLFPLSIVSQPPQNNAVNAATCDAPQPLHAGDTVNIAVLLFLIDQPCGWYQGDITDTTATAVPGYGVSIIQPYMLSIDLYVREFRKRQNQLPLPNGLNVTLNFVYINMANCSGPLTASDYSKVDPASNLPLFIIRGTFPSYNNSASAPGGLFSTVVSQDPAVLLANFGISTPFTFVIPSALLVDSPTVALANLVEQGTTHVVVHPFASSKELFVCDGKPSDVSTTPDCLSPVYGRDRRNGARRFQSMLSVLMDSTYNQFSALDSFHLMGVRSIVIIRERYSPSSTFSYWASETTRSGAEQLGIDVYETIAMEVAVDCDSSRPPNATAPPHCPPNTGAGKYQNQVFSNNRTGLDVAKYLQQLNPDAVVILAAPRSSGGYTLGQLFQGMKQIDWAPKALSWGGGVDGGMNQWLESPQDKLYSFTTVPFDFRLKGPGYRNVLTDTSFELLPANATHDGPAIFYDAYESAYGANAHWGPGGSSGAHPMYVSNWLDNSMPSLGWAALLIVQKLIEQAATTDVESILNVAKGIQTPGLHHAIQFDQQGHISGTNQVLLQTQSTGNIVISPYNIGANPIFPMPGWGERVFNPIMYSETSERIMLVFNSLSILLCGILILFVCCFQDASIIRAATPLFCIIILAGGILMLISNYFATLVVYKNQCVTSIWLLTTGFTLTFSALFIKTWRIFRIFSGNKRLQKVLLKDGQLMYAVVGSLCIDVLINVIWQTSIGIDVEIVTVDPLRPSLNYLQCNFSGRGASPIYAHIAVKGALLLFGIFMAYCVRDTPSQFNESWLIGICLYNVSFVCVFVMPIISQGLGGRRTACLLRAYAIMFVAMATMIILYVPKLLHIYNNKLYDKTMSSIVPNLRFDNASVVAHATHSPADGPDFIVPGKHLHIDPHARVAVVVDGRAEDRSRITTNNGNNPSPFSAAREPPAEYPYPLLPATPRDGTLGRAGLHPNAQGDSSSHTPSTMRVELTPPVRPGDHKPRYTIPQSSTTSAPAKLIPSESKPTPLDVSSSSGTVIRHDANKRSLELPPPSPSALNPYQNDKSPGKPEKPEIPQDALQQLGAQLADKFGRETPSESKGKLKTLVAASKEMYHQDFYKAPANSLIGDPVTPDRRPPHSSSKVLLAVVTPLSRNSPLAPHDSAKTTSSSSSDRSVSKQKDSEKFIPCSN